MKIFYIKVLQLYFLFSLTTAETWTRFESIKLFDEDVCKGSDVVFSERNLNKKTMCLIECTKNIDCKLIVYDLLTGDCTGCPSIESANSSSTSDIFYYEAGRCPAGWFNIQDSCYFITSHMTFADGATECQSLNAHPVTMETEEENTMLKSKLGLIESSDPTDMYFTGYTDAALEGTWVVYGSTETLSISGWGQGEPNGGDLENCHTFYQAFDFQWADIRCDILRRMICEKEILG